MTGGAVTVELQGGLGNQMFQYAAGFAVAQRSGAALQLDVTELARDPKRGFMLDCYGLSPDIGRAERPAVAPGKLRVLAGRAVQKLHRMAQPDGDGVYRQPGFHFDEAFAGVRAPVRLVGWFQSALYFEEAAAALRERFTIRVPVSPEFERQMNQIAGAACAVAVHVRRQDYVAESKTLAYHGICEAPYYRRAMQLAPALSGTAPRYFVFTDDVASARQLFADVDVTFVTGDTARPWEDMALMAACRGHIIANSSFSWWGAWLSQAVDKWIIAPRDWFARPQLRKVSTADLYGNDWITL